MDIFCLTGGFDLACSRLILLKEISFLDMAEMVRPLVCGRTRCSWILGMDFMLHKGIVSTGKNLETWKNCFPFNLNTVDFHFLT